MKLVTMERTAADKGYGELLKKAVSGMLPKNRLRKVRLDRLKVFDGSSHPYEQNITAFAVEQPKILDLIQEKKQK